MSGILVNNVNKCEVNYRNNKFIISSYDCNSQYNLLYKSRRNLMRRMIEKSIAKKWPNKNLVVLRVRDISDNCYRSVDKLIIIGTLIKHMKLQPNILKELNEQNNPVPKPILNNFTSDDDFLSLQDGDDIIEITGNIDPSTHVTGVCVALLGIKDEKNTRFLVEDTCYATGIQQINSFTISQTDQYVSLISGLGFSKNMNTNAELSNALIMLLNYFRGDILAKFSVKQVSHVIIAGNYIGLNARNQESYEENMPKWDRTVKAQSIIATELFDKFAHSLAQFVNLDIMPGELDPTTQFLPQQPLHSCIFNKSKHLTSVNCVTNPHCAQYNGRVFLGCSGQNIKSVLQYSKITNEMEAISKTIEWCHLAPTTPDTLSCYPFVDTDPFVISEYPDVYFAGNQQEFSTGSFESPNGKKVTLISVPIFEKKFSCVLVNLNSLKSELLLF